MKIWAHTLFRNEERYLWFAVKSVIDYVDKLLLWDTGSEDKSLKIAEELKKIYPEKIDFRKWGKVDINQFTVVRQKMLEQTKSDWFMILDADEVWWDESVRRHIEVLRKEGQYLDSLVSGYFNLVGDIYHYQEERAGKYKIDGKVGHLNIRFVNRKIPALAFSKPHGQLGIFDEKGTLIQDRNSKLRRHLGVSYLHFTNVQRSASIEKDFSVPKRKIKMKYELGRKFPYDFYYPEIFFKKRPGYVSSPWVKRGANYVLKASFQTPLKYLNRIIFQNGKSGY